MTTLGFMWDMAVSLWPWFALVALVVQIDYAIQGPARLRFHLPLFLVLFSAMFYGFWGMTT